MPDTFDKTYTYATKAAAAVRHHRWLAALGAPVPALTEAVERRLRFERLVGRHAGLKDLKAVAELLGCLHARAYARELCTARLGEDFASAEVPVIPGFTALRLARLREYERSRLISSQQAGEATDRIHQAEGEPAAFYKDSNVRNVLVSASGVVLVDFDDLTLAPFGYDLGKLLVSAAMTHGPLTYEVYAGAFEAYTAGVESVGGPSDACTWDDLVGWMNVHDLLTRPYFGRGGYYYPWKPPTRSR